MTQKGKSGGKEMKKRIFALATALVMTLSMGMTAFAAKSPVVDDTPSGGPNDGATSATAVIDGKKVDLDFTWHYLNMRAEATEAQLEQLNYYMPTDSIRDGDEEAERRFEEKTKQRTCELFEKVMGYRDENVIRYDFFGLALPEGYNMPAEGVEVTINAPYAGQGDYIYYVFHCKADGTWEYIPTTEGDRTLTGRFTSFSPVLVLGAPRTEAAVSSGKPAKEVTAEMSTIATTSVAKAPKTGEFAGIYVAGMMAFLSAAGIVVYVKRNRVGQ